MTFITRMTWFWVPQSGHCNHCTSRLSLSATARMACAGARVPHPTHVTRSTRLFSTTLASLYRSRAPEIRTSAAEEEAPSFLVSRYCYDLRPSVRPLVLLQTSVRASHEFRRPSDRNSGRYWVRNNAQMHKCPCSSAPTLGGVHVSERLVCRRYSGLNALRPISKRPPVGGTTTPGEKAPTSR